LFVNTEPCAAITAGNTRFLDCYLV